MIKSVTITNHLNETIKLPLTEPEETGMVITSIEGLGPVNADVHFTELATLDGAVDNSARLNSRNIVMNLRFLEKPTIEDVRLLTYKYFPIKQNIMFTIETDNRLCSTIGRVEKNEPKIFDQYENTQISILCPDPYFYKTTNENLIFYGVNPLFEFPFSNESLTDPLIEFGEIYTMTEGTIYYDGDTEVGIVIEIHAIGEAEGIVIYNTGTRKSMGIDDTKLRALVGDGIKAGDRITINTTRGNKSITLLRAGRTYNILNSLTKPLYWFTLVKGNNTFVYTATAGLTNLQFKISYKIVYEGV